VCHLVTNSLSFDRVEISSCRDCVATFNITPSMGSSKSKPSRCICVGLDNSGKSTIINYLKPEKEKKTETFATVGFQAEAFKHGNINFTMWYRYILIYNLI
jgi:ribosome biogenesis GTPase A